MAKTIGLSFRKSIEPVLLQTRWGIHTFFMQQTIDVFILDDDFTVRKIKRNLKPFSVFLWNPRYQNVIEAPVRLPELNNIKIEDKIKVL